MTNLQNNHYPIKHIDMTKPIEKTEGFEVYCYLLRGILEDNHNDYKILIKDLDLSLNEVLIAFEDFQPNTTKEINTTHKLINNLDIILGTLNKLETLNSENPHFKRAIRYPVGIMDYLYQKEIQDSYEDEFINPIQILGGYSCLAYKLVKKELPKTESVRKIEAILDGICQHSKTFDTIAKRGSISNYIDKQ